MTAKMTAAGRERLDELRIEAGLDQDQPWGGRSPRALIQEGIDKRIESVSLGRVAATPDDLGDELIDEQHRRWLADARFHEGG